MLHRVSKSVMLGANGREDKGLYRVFFWVVPRRLNYICFIPPAYEDGTLRVFRNVCIPTIPHRLYLSLWPSFTLTQFLTNHGKFRSYLYKIKKASSPASSCPEQVAQTARHLRTECSLFSRNRPAVLHNLPHTTLKHHIHTVSFSNFLSSIVHSLTD